MFPLMSITQPQKSGKYLTAQLGLSSTIWATLASRHTAAHPQTLRLAVGPVVLRNEGPIVQCVQRGGCTYACSCSVQALSIRPHMDWTFVVPAFYKENLKHGTTPATDPGLVTVRDCSPKGGRICNPLAWPQDTALIRMLSDI